MINLISGVIAYIGSFFNKIQIKNFLNFVLVGSILLTMGMGNMGNEHSSQGSNLSDRQIKKVLSKDDPDRPTTTRQWNKEARQTAGKPGERLEKIGKESAEAVKDFGSLYPDVAERSIPTLKD
jgi:hypothetical protein